MFEVNKEYSTRRPMLNYSILYDPSWVEFNTRKWDCHAKQHCFQLKNGAAKIETVFFYKGGHIFQPGRTPYMPIHFSPGLSEYESKRTHEWLKLAEEMIQIMKYHGISSRISFMPGTYDLRPWIWDGSFQIGLKYTYLFKLPYNLNQATNNYRNRVKKALKSGMRCVRFEQVEPVYPCIAHIEAKLSLIRRFSSNELSLAHELLGDDKFRIYACLTPKGEVISAGIVLYGGTGVAIGWIGGTRPGYLSSGAAQLIEAYTLDDLSSCGADYYDLFGASMPSIANSKSYWNGHLTCYPYVESIRLKDRIASGIKKVGEILLSKM